LEAEIASLPACNLTDMDKKNIRQNKPQKLRHHSDSSATIFKQKSKGMYQIKMS